MEVRVTRRRTAAEEGPTVRLVLKGVAASRREPPLAPALPSTQQARAQDEPPAVAGGSVQLRRASGSGACKRQRADATDSAAFLQRVHKGVTVRLVYSGHAAPRQPTPTPDAATPEGQQTSSSDPPPPPPPRCSSCGDEVGVANVRGGTSALELCHSCAANALSVAVCGAVGPPCATTAAAAARPAAAAYAGPAAYPVEVYGAAVSAYLANPSAYAVYPAAAMPPAAPRRQPRRQRSGSPGGSSRGHSPNGASAARRRRPVALDSDGMPIGNVSTKFVPIADLRAPVHTPAEEEGHVPIGASILIVMQPWLGLILDGRKTLEIRGRQCKKPPGERIYLALSGGGGVVLGSVSIVGCHGPLSEAEWAERRAEHCVDGPGLPYETTFAWEVCEPVRFKAPVPYHHKHGVVVWAVMTEETGAASSRCAPPPRSRLGTGGLPGVAIAAAAAVATAAGPGVASAPNLAPASLVAQTEPSTARISAASPRSAPPSDSLGGSPLPGVAIAAAAAVASRSSPEATPPQEAQAPPGIQFQTAAVVR